MSRSKRQSSGDVVRTVWKYKAVTVETKVKIIEGLQWGEKMVDAAPSYNMNHSTTARILKNKYKIVEYVKFIIMFYFV